MSPVHTDVDPVLHTFASALRARLGNHIQQIVLFGSRARGEAREHSDYDVLVIVDRRSPDVRSVILEIEADLMDRYGALVATILRTDAEWRVAQGLPLARNIALEGVPL